MASSEPIRIAITGAAGQIGYALIPMIARGDMFGPTQPVILQLIDLPFAMEALGGVKMELEDGYFPLVRDVICTDDANVGFRDADAAVLLGAFPRKQGMERKDLMLKNVGIFKDMGQAINNNAKASIRVLIVGNPANTNALVCSHFAPKVPKENFSALTRLDHNRAAGQIAMAVGANVDDVKNVIIWGNHSSTQYPDVSHGTVQGADIKTKINNNTWLQGEFIKTVQSRGAAIIDARKASSALSAARASVCHMRDWFCGTKDGEFVSMGVISSGKYGIASGLMYSMPVRCNNRNWEVVEGLPIDAFSQTMMRNTEKELMEEREMAMDICSKM